LFESKNEAILINANTAKLSFEPVNRMNKKKEFYSVILLLLLGIATISTLLSSSVSAQDEEIFVMAYPSDVGEMNPLFSRSERTGWYLIQVYDSLIAYNTTMDPIPWLAESWEISEDAKNFTFHIREGMKWHDGATLNASDIQFTLNYTKHAPEDALSWSVLQKMEECTVHDEYTVSAVFNESLGFGLMQIGEINIIPKHIRDWGNWMDGESQHAECWDDPDNVTAHTGSGPFKFVERVEEAYILLEKNPYWWGKEPNVDGIRIDVISGQGARILAMRQGVADTERYELMGAADIKAVTDAPELKVITEEQPVPSQWDYVLGFNLTISGLDDPVVRKAISYALNRTEMIEIARGGHGTATYSTIPESYFPAYYNESGRFPETNVTYANQLLDDAGYIDTDEDGIRNFPASEDELSFDLQVLSWDTISVDAGTAIASELEEIDISVTVEITDDAVMYPNIYELPRDYRMYEMSHGFGGYPDHVWWRMHSCNDIDWGDNCYGLHNDTMDTALNALLHATNDTARTEAAAEVQELSVETAPYIPLFLSDDTHAIRKEWVNYTFVPGGIFTSMNRLTMLNIHSDPNLIPPDITIKSPKNETYDTADVSLTFTVSEDTDWIGYSLDGAANVPITGNTTLTDLSLGSHNIIVYANDTDGNMGMSNIVHFTIVETPLPPVIAIISPENTTYTSKSVALTLDISEDTDWIGYSLDGAANVTITGDITLTDLSLGSHNIIVYANDTAGLMGSSDTIYFTIEEAPPPEMDWTLIVAVVIIICIVVGAVAVYLTRRRK
jgi:nickel transport system substrate-binding protein